LIDPDTADRHVLTLTGPILTGVPTMSFEAYDFPKNIREGAPIFPHSGDLAASIVVVEGAIALQVSEGEVLSQFTVEAEGITADTNIFRSGDWNGTVDSNGEITGFSSAAGWAFSGAGHFEFTDG